MGDIYSPHGGTFSEGVPNFSFIENSELFLKCPSCDGKKYKDNYCFDCGEGYSNKEKIFQIILDSDGEENLMKSEDIEKEKKYIKESRGKERRNY